MGKTSIINIQIAIGDSRPIFKQIVDGIRMQIAQGELTTGSKLPSVRGLATQLTINPNTVAKAYTLLTEQCLVEARKGLGLFVAQPRQIFTEQEREQKLEHAVDTFVNEIAYLAYSKREILDRLGKAVAKLEMNDVKAKP